jgi:sialate O-acetylesterase
MRDCDVEVSSVLEASSAITEYHTIGQGKDMMQRKVLAILALLIPGALAVDLSAQIMLSEIFRDHMVLQRQQPIPVWGTASAGSSISVKLDKSELSTVAAADGRWRLVLPAHQAGGPFTLLVVSGKKTVSFEDVLLGDVWLASGQSNMSMVMRPMMPWTMGVLDYQQEITSAKENNVRFFTVPEEGDYPEQTEMHGFWQVSQGSQICNVSAIAYYFARKVNHETGIPIGVIISAVGSSGIDDWTEMAINRNRQPADMAATDKLLSDNAAAVVEYQKTRPEVDRLTEANIKSMCSGGVTSAYHKPPFPNFLFKRSAIYNAMIAPLHQVPIKGVIWYQGEADAKWYPGYGERMQDLISSWRVRWHQPKMPFYFVQLAGLAPQEKEGYNFDPHSLNFANLREKQRIVSLVVPNTGMVVSADLGDPMFVHPRNKKPVGERLALLALANDYGMKVVSSGPTIKSMSRSGDQLQLHFDNHGAPLMVNTGTRPYGFEIAGADKIFYPAVAILDGDTVTLSSPMVRQPLNARYGWREAPYLSLYNAAGLPATPFTTEAQ